MKTFVLSWKLFLKKPFSNAVLAVELAVTLLLVMIFSNVYQYNRNCIDILQNSEYRMLNCENPNAASTDAAGSEQEQKEFLNRLKKLQKKYPYVKGVASCYPSTISFKKEYLEKQQGIPETEGSELYVYDPVTFAGVRYPLSSGTWPQAKPDDGKVPCLVGGIYAKRYKVGDTISSYMFSPSSTGKESENMKCEKSPDFKVEGILALPQQCLQIGPASSASDCFKDMTNRAMYMIVPDNLFHGMSMGITSGSGIIYLDRSSTQAQIDAVRSELPRGDTQLDTELIAQEQKNIGQKLQEEMPFLLVLFLVVFLGLIAVTMLTTMKNMQTFKIYYLTGCPRRKIVLMMFWYVLFYFVFSGILFAIFLFCVRAAMKGQALVLQAYLILLPSSFPWIAAVCAVDMLCSLVVPSVLIHKNDLAALLRKD